MSRTSPLRAPRLDQEGLERAKATGKLELYSVPTAAMCSAMETRGYQRVFVNDLGDDTHLPPRIQAAAGSSSRRSMAPPTTRLPAGGFPPAKNASETPAEQIVREWELHVEVDDQFYSPAYKWTMGARKAAGLTDYDMSVSFNIIDVSHTYPFDPS